MTSSRASFLFICLICLSANVFAQFDYDSIALEIGYSLEENFEYKEIEEFNKKFNNEIFLSYVVLDNAEDNEQLKIFNDEILKKSYGTLLFEQIQSYLSVDSYYNFVNYYIDDLKNIFIIFRLYLEDGGINYHQYLFEPSGVAEYRMTDVYIYLAGEYFSETLQGVFYSMIEGTIDDEGNLDVGSDNFSLMAALGQVRKMKQKGNIEKARKLFFEIPEEQRSTRELVFLELELTDINDEVAYKKLMERMIEYADEGDPSFYLSTIDYHFLNEDFDKVIESIDSLYEYTGDEFLEIYKGTSYIEMEKYEEAEKSFLLANEYYPDMPPTYDYLLYHYDLTDDKKKFLNTIDSMSKYLFVEFPIMDDMLKSEYPSIILSEEYLEWKEARSKEHYNSLDSLNNLLIGKWVFEGMEKLDGSKLETTEFWEEGYGKVRPNYSFNKKEIFSSQLKGEKFENGFWYIDIASETIDFRSKFDKKSEKGQKIIDNGNYVKENKIFYEVYSLYFLSIGETELKLYDPYEGILIYRKEK